MNEVDVDSTKLKAKCPEINDELIRENLTECELR